MSLFTGLTKEFKVGMLAVVSLTILILGYNFMLGKDFEVEIFKFSCARILSWF